MQRAGIVAQDATRGGIAIFRTSHRGPAPSSNRRPPASVPMYVCPLLRLRRQARNSPIRRIHDQRRSPVPGRPGLGGVLVRPTRPTQQFGCERLKLSETDEQTGTKPSRGAASRLRVLRGARWDYTYSSAAAGIALTGTARSRVDLVHHGSSTRASRVRSVWVPGVCSCSRTRSICRTADVLTSNEVFSQKHLTATIVGRA
jgi:hypothetical protein